MTGSLLMTSKYERLVEVLKSAIESGDFPEGAKIASENELCQLYGISRPTVREALNFLTHQGYLSRAQGKGTFVRSRQPQSPGADTYAIFIHAHGHVFETQTRALVRSLQRQEAMPLVFDVADFKSDAEADRLLEKVLEQGVAGVVVEDEGLWPRLKAVADRINRPMPLAVSLNYPAQPGLPVKAVVSDFRYGIRLATRHLIGLGRRRIQFVIHRNLFAHPGETPEKMAGLYGEICRGYAEAMAEAGLKARYFTMEGEFRPDSGDRERFSAELNDPGRPDALVVFGDYVAKEALALAQEAGLRVPDDLALVGYWNTPWADMTRPALTSVSIREDEIAKLAAEKLLEARKNGDRTAETTVIQPRLVIRRSCGARLEKEAKED